MNTATASHPAALVAARRNLAAATGAVRDLDPETVARIVERIGAEKWAAMTAQVAEIAATIPALQTEVAELEARSCTRCAGTGDYSGPTGHYRNRRPVCFDCGGSGVRRK